LVVDNASGQRAARPAAMPSPALLFVDADELVRRLTRLASADPPLHLEQLP
jgi:hypothetical protein